MSAEFDGRVALITGAAGAGIGQATARRLAAGGARVVVTDIHERRTHDVSERLADDFPDTTVLGIPMDAGDRAQIDATVARVTDELGPIQILVNNAAVNVVGTIFDYDPEHWDWCMRVNLSGPWYLCRAVMPLMRDAGGGVIVNVSSYAPDVGGGGVEAPYAIAKGGLNVLTRSSRARGRPLRHPRRHRRDGHRRRHQVHQRPPRDRRGEPEPDRPLPRRSQRRRGHRLRRIGPSARHHRRDRERRRGLLHAQLSTPPPKSSNRRSPCN